MSPNLHIAVAAASPAKATMAHAMTLFDLQFFAWLNAGPQTPHWHIALAAFVSGWLPALLVLLLACVAARRPAWRQALWAALLSLVLVWLAVRVFRVWLPMPRPGSLDLGIQWLAQGDRPGFPSLHAAGAFAVAVSVLRRCGARWGAFYVGCATLIALSRVYLGMHFPTDIVVGALFGALAAWLVERGFVLLGRAHGLRRAAA